MERCRDCEDYTPITESIGICGLVGLEAHGDDAACWIVDWNNDAEGDWDPCDDCTYDDCTWCPYHPDAIDEEEECAITR